MWVLFACGSAFFAGLTSILAKCGIRKTDSDVATAIRTIVVLAFSWLMVFIAGSASSISQISTSTWIFLILSGCATGASWLCYFRALQLGDVNKVVPIDKSSTILTIVLAFIFLGEPISLPKGIAVVLIGVGTYMMIEKKTSTQKNPATETSKANINSAGNAAARDAAPITTGAQTTASIGVQKTATKAAENATAEADAAGAAASGAAAASHARTKATCTANASIKRTWLIYALLSAIFAALTSILGKAGIEGVESNLGTAIRTCVVLIMAWVVVFAKGKQGSLRTTPKNELGFICLSGVVTGASWLCYYRALQDGLASVVAPIDKLSILVSVAFSALVFNEHLSKKAAVGLTLIVAGTLLMVVPF